MYYTYFTVNQHDNGKNRKRVAEEREIDDRVCFFVLRACNNGGDAPDKNFSFVGIMDVLKGPTRAEGTRPGYERYDNPLLLYFRRNACHSKMKHPRKHWILSAGEIGRASCRGRG